MLQVNSNPLYLSNLLKIINVFFSGLENPTVVVGIIFVILFSIFSIMDCLMGKEGKYSLNINFIKNKTIKSLAYM